MTEKENIIYILGNQYSGSTLLGFLLGSSKEIFNAGEISDYLSIASKSKKIEIDDSLKYNLTKKQKIILDMIEKNDSKNIL